MSLWGGLVVIGLAFTMQYVRMNTLELFSWIICGITVTSIICRWLRERDVKSIHKTVDRIHDKNERR